VFTIKSDDGQQSYQRGFLYVADGGEDSLTVSGLSGVPSFVWKNNSLLTFGTDYTVQDNVVSFVNLLIAGDYILVYSDLSSPQVLEGTSIGSTNSGSTILTKRYILQSDVPALQVSISATALTPASPHVSAFAFAPDNNNAPVMTQAQNTLSLSSIHSGVSYYFWVVITIPPNQPTESWNDVAFIVTGSPLSN